MDRFLVDCKEKYISIMNSAPHLITSLNKDGLIIDCNNRIYEMLGYNKDEAIGLSILDFLHPDYHYKAVETWNGIITKGYLNKAQMKMITKTGKDLDVVITSTSFKEEPEENYTRIWVIEPSENKEQDNKLIYTNGTGARAEVYLDILSYDIKHLTSAITTYSELLLMKPDLSKQYRRYFETTLQYSKTISNLISNVRGLSYIKNNIFELRDIDVFRTLADAIDHVQQERPHRQFKINQSISEDEVIVKSFDMLENAFINIINNALEFEKHNDIVLEITHTLSEDGKYWKLEFKDNGPGVPDALKDKIFYDFEIGNEHKHGSGLGLALVKEVILKSNGHVWVEDRVSGEHTKGCNFVVMLPVSSNSNEIDENSNF